MPDPDSLELRPQGTGTTLRLRVKTKARTDALLGIHGGALKLSVRAAPEEGKANEGIRQLLARTLGLAASSVEILSGASSQNKTVLIRGMTEASLRLELTRLLGDRERRPE